MWNTCHRYSTVSFLKCKCHIVEKAFKAIFDRIQFHLFRCLRAFRTYAFDKNNEVANVMNNMESIASHNNFKNFVAY